MEIIDGRHPDDFIPGVFRDFYRDSRGNFWVLTEGSHDAVVFDRHGRFVRRSGTEGRGPGEFVGPLLVTEGPEGIYIADEGADRVTVQDLSGKFLRSFPVSLLDPRSMVVGEDSLIGIAQADPSKAFAGFPVHVFDQSGERLYSIGETAMRLDSRRRFYRRLAVGDDGLWSAHYTRYRLELWSSDDGSLLKVIEDPSSRWLTGEVSLSRPDPDNPPSSQVVNIILDEDGLLWLVGVKADDDFASAFGPRRRDRLGNERYPVEDFDKLWDTVIEVIDPATGQRLAQTVVDRAFSWFSANRTLASPGAMTNADDGSIDVYRARLVR